MAVESSRWGILYCPRHSFRASRKHRQKVEAALAMRNVEYDLIQSESSSSVERLVRMLIHNGYKTIVIVGGDSALNDAVNCLMECDLELRRSIALGIIPNGVLNDFAKFWGIRDNEIERAVDIIVSRRVRMVDLGCLRYTAPHGTDCHRYFINCVNVGLIADMMNMRRKWHSLSLIFHRMEYRMHLRINGEDVERKVMNVCVGSGPGYGQTPNAVPYNGMVDVSIVSHAEITQLFHGLWLLFTGRFLNHRHVLPYRTRKVEFLETSRHALVGVDGRLLGKTQGAFTVTCEQEVVNLIIPS